MIAKEGAFETRRVSRHFMSLAVVSSFVLVALTLGPVGNLAAGMAAGTLTADAVIAAAADSNRDIHRVVARLARESAHG